MVRWATCFPSAGRAVRTGHGRGTSVPHARAGLYNGCVPEIIHDGLNRLVRNEEEEFAQAVSRIEEINRSVCRRRRSDVSPRRRGRRIRPHLRPTAGANSGWMTEFVGTQHAIGGRAFLPEEDNMDEQNRKYIAKYVEDLHSLVSHGLQPFSHQLGESGLGEHPEARQAIDRFYTTLQRHESALKGRLEALGTSPTTTIQDSAAAVAGVAAGLYNRVRTEAVSKSIRDDYAFLSLANISWLMLVTTARSLGDHDTEELAEQGYRDTARMAMEIDHLMPALVVQEMQHDKLPAQNVAEWARVIVHGAWNRETAGAAT